MTTPAAAPSEYVSTRRQQKFSDFKLQPGDSALLPSLSAEQRTVLECEGQYKDRAQQLGLPIGTVRSRLHRARAALLRLREEQAGIKADPIDERTH
jgi:hypothetical protein